MKLRNILAAVRRTTVAPVRERGLKCNQEAKSYHHIEGRSREGAWIEILKSTPVPRSCIVAPVRERGLKFYVKQNYCYSYFVAPVRERGLKLHTDTTTHIARFVAPVRERGLKSALAFSVLVCL